MLLLIRNDLPNDCHGLGIGNRQRGKLMFQMFEDDALDRLGRERDRPTTEQTRHQTQHEPAEAAEMKAPASAHATPRELRREQRAVSLFVGDELVDLAQD